MTKTPGHKNVPFWHHLNGGGGCVDQMFYYFVQDCSSYRYKHHGITLNSRFIYLNWKYIYVKANEPLCREDGVRDTKVIYMLKQIWHLGSVLKNNYN